MGTADNLSLIIVDLEATCWGPGDTIKGENEIIEIGAVRLPVVAKSDADGFGALVRPVRYPELSPFCVQLLAITQTEVDSAETFPVVWKRFLSWCGDPGSFRIAAWGANDVPMLKRDCEYHRLDYPFNDDWMNIKQLFADSQNGRKFGMKGALRIMEIPLVGSHHRALDDARNIRTLFVKPQQQGLVGSSQ